MTFYDFSKTLFLHPTLLLLFTFFIASSIPFASSEIKNTLIVDNSEPYIEFDRFGFTEGGHVAISVEDVSWKSDDPKAQLNHSSMGFFLAKEDPFLGPFINESLNNDSSCVLDNPYVKLLFKFSSLGIDDSTYNGSIVVDDPDQYTLMFRNCQPEFEVSMNVHTEMYNVQNGVKNFLSAGQTTLPSFYFLLFLIYICLFDAWIFICIKQKPTVQKIHLIMGALLVVKALKMICASEDKMYVSRTGTPHGWDIAFYIFGFLKAIMLFTVVILIGTGWSFLKPCLQDRERKILMAVIPLQVLENIAYVAVNEFGPAIVDMYLWNQVIFFMIDMTCLCLVILPILWSMDYLRVASKSDGKAALILEKLTLFRNFYAAVLMYMYLARFIVDTAQKSFIYNYDWLADFIAEGTSLAFYVYIFYNFRPVESNPYLRIHDEDDQEEEIAARPILQDGADPFDV